MQKYENRGGDSSVLQYQIGPNFILVGFNSGSVYEYTYLSAGTRNIEAMKSLALLGQGLCSFIQRNVRRNYSRKIR
jgi:hypothetical protein